MKFWDKLKNLLERDEKKIALIFVLGLASLLSASFAIIIYLSAGIQAYALCMALLIVALLFLIPCLGFVVYFYRERQKRLGKIRAKSSYYSQNPRHSEPTPIVEPQAPIVDGEYSPDDETPSTNG